MVREVVTDVLIVEPSKDLALIIAQALARHERSSVIAQTAQAGIEQADQKPPRLIILELLMPKHNGLEFIHELRSHCDWLDVPIVIYSHLSNDELGISPSIMDQMGIAAHLYKPASSLETLVGTVEKVLA